MRKQTFCFIGLFGAMSLLGISKAEAGGLERVRFEVVDPTTRVPIQGVVVRIEDMSGKHLPELLTSSGIASNSTVVFDTRRWQAVPNSSGFNSRLTALLATLITIPEGKSTLLQTPPGEKPLREIFIKVTATRIQVNRSPIAPTETRDRTQIERVTGASGSLSNVTRTVSGVAADSNGQQHVRGEHAEIAYVVDGVPLPDTLSGRQGSIVVPSTIDKLEILTGGFAPEFGGQTAAILNIETLRDVKTISTETIFEGGSYDTTNANFTTQGPLGKQASYVLNLGATRTRNALEPQQPDNQTAHNSGSSQSYFTKLSFKPGKHDSLSFTLSRSPDTMQLNNRTGLPARFEALGQGYGFLGLRNADGSRPDVTAANASSLGAANFSLLSQQADGQDITQREVSEFTTLAWHHEISARTSGQLSLTLLHSGQDVHNQNPSVDVLNLPVDSSIEYNPTAIRNVHHVQIGGSITSRTRAHQFKAGFVLDDQNGNETYQIVPASQLALDALANLSPNLAPAGSVVMNAGNPVTDINGNPVYKPSGTVSPTLMVHRSGFYRAGYVQDTWQASKKMIVNYGFRGDWYKQGQNLGQGLVNTIMISPRLNMSYTIDRYTAVRASYDKLFNTPPLAQGSVVGQAILPETLDQYDISLERKLPHNQSLKIAYYVKQMHNQVDTGLLIPGSQIGLYSAVNFQIGGVHGVEISYDISPAKGIGWDGFLNYTNSSARPNGLDNTGSPAPNFNDHDQTQTVSIGLGYTWKSKASADLTITHGSGLASSPISADGKRIPRTQIDLHLSTGPGVFRGMGGFGMSVENLLDDRTVINYQSGFSGTRFMMGRKIYLSVFGKW